MIKLNEYRLGLAMGRKLLEHFKNSLKPSDSYQYVKLLDDEVVLFKFKGAEIENIVYFDTKKEMLEYAKQLGIKKYMDNGESKEIE